MAERPTQALVYELLQLLALLSDGSESGHPMRALSEQASSACAGGHFSPGARSLILGEIGRKAFAASKKVEDPRGGGGLTDDGGNIVWLAALRVIGQTSELAAELGSGKLKPRESLAVSPPPLLRSGAPSRQPTEETEDDAHHSQLRHKGASASPPRSIPGVEHTARRAVGRGPRGAGWQAADI